MGLRRLGRSALDYVQWGRPVKGGRRARARQRRFGVDVVPVSAVRDACTETVSPNSLGFEIVKPGVYARKVDDDIIQRFGLTDLKGRQYCFSWGVCLPFIPWEWKTAPRYHRTIKTALQVLSARAPDEAGHEGLSDAVVARQLIDGLHGLEPMQEDLDRCWAWVEPRMNAWLDGASTLEGVLQLALAQTTREPFGWDEIAWPRPRLVAAMVRARLGQAAEAQEDLEEYLSRGEESEESAQVLQRVVADLSSG